MRKEYTYIDELSGVYNRHYLREQQEKEIKISITRNIPLSVVIVDIDHFKAINDIHGHIKGDEVIKGFAQFLKGALRRSDKVIRYGGDEFVCVMPETTKQDAEWIYRRVLRRCAEQEFGGLKITLSAGVASYPDDGQDFEELLHTADRVLYDAKRSGRARLGVMRSKQAVLPMKVFIDRIEEKEMLNRILVNGRGRLIVAVLKGNVGIGKTRLVKQVLGDITGKEIIWGDCIFLADNIPYYPIRETLKYHIKRWGTEILRDMPLVYKYELGKLLPDVMEQIVENSEGVDLVLDRYRLYEGVRRVIEIGGPEKVIVIDNIQWIDRESTEVIKYLLRALKDNPLIFVFIYRIEEMTDVLEEFLSYISREVAVEEIELRPFAYAEVKESVKSIIGDEPEQGLVRYVVQESGGIPFYIEELMRGLLDGGYLVVEGERWVFREPDKEIVPKSIEDVTMRKFRSLKNEAQHVLETASVTGRFDVEIIKSITGYNEGEIIGFINDISRLGMVKYTRDRFEFAEEISRNAIYKRVVKEIKGMELHRKVGRKIEVQSKGREHEVVEELAFHYYRGQEFDKGVFYCMKAGDRAKEKYANRAAIKYYTWALELLEDEQSEEKAKAKIDCLVRKAEVLNLIGESEEALSLLERGQRASEEIDDKKRAADVTYKKASINFRLSRFREAIKDAEGCKEMLEKCGNRIGAAESLNLIGNAYSKLGKYERALDFYRQSLNIFTELKKRHGEAIIHNNIGNVFGILGDYHNALKAFKDSLKIAEEIEYKNLLPTSLCNVGVVYRTLGDSLHALKYFEDALRIAQEIGDKRGEATIYNNIGNVYSDLGEHRNELKFNEDSLRMYREIGDKSNMTLTLSASGFAYISLGEYHRALKLFKEALETAREIGDRRMEAYALNGMGTVYEALGDYENALKFYEESHRIIKQIRVAGIGFDNLISRARLLLKLNRMPKAKELIDKAYNIAKDSHSKIMVYNAVSLLCEFYLEQENLEGFQKVVKCIGDLGKDITVKNYESMFNLLVGRYYTKIKDFKKADMHLRKSLVTFEGLGEKPRSGQAYYYLGIMESTKGDKSRSIEYLEKSLKIFKSINAKTWESKVKEMLK